MRHSLLAFLLLSLGQPLVRGDPRVDVSPFEPRYALCFDWIDKFAHPPEAISPRIAYPEEMRVECILGEVVALVVLKEDGSPERIAILYDTHLQEDDANGRYFTDAVIAGLKDARWEAQTKEGVWFYYKTTFVLIDEGDPVPTAPGTVVGVAPVSNIILR